MVKYGCLYVKVTMDEKTLLNNIPAVTNPWGVPNQFIIRTNECVLFQSYESPIAMHKGGEVYIFKNWAYSVTTGKYRNLFLGESKQETFKKLLSGEYIAVDFEVEK